MDPTITGPQPNKAKNGLKGGQISEYFKKENWEKITQTWRNFSLTQTQPSSLHYHHTTLPFNPSLSSLVAALLALLAPDLTAPFSVLNLGKASNLRKNPPVLALPTVSISGEKVHNFVSSWMQFFICKKFPRHFVQI